ncbi:Holliday junction resolvase RuvX [Candidatus Uhrbacteria bacterium]|nr:Holliday junction resolvase RuvX [Candidatus Uhrbacteria bacterium]
MRFLGIDYGRTYVGLALGDSETKVSVPLTTFTPKNFEELTEKLTAIIQSESIDTLVVGVPLIGEQYQKQKQEILSFVEKLKQSVQISVDVYDESFTSKEASRRLQGSSVHTTNEHAVAAMLILQGYLDRYDL